MVVYIQKKINGKWRTFITCDWKYSRNAYDHLCLQYCKDKFRISLDKTDDMPPEPQGLSLDRAIDALCDIRLVGLTWKQSTETRKKIMDIISDVDKWHKY